MEAMKPVKVYSAKDKVEAGMLVNLLEGNGIQAYKQGVGSGGYMDICYGFSVFGEDIFVDEQDADRARELIREVTAEGDKEEETGDTDDTEDQEEIAETEEAEETEASGGHKKKYSKTQILFVRVWVAVMIAAVAFSIISQLI